MKKKSNKTKTNKKRASQKKVATQVILKSMLSWLPIEELVKYIPCNLEKHLGNCKWEINIRAHHLNVGYDDHFRKLSQRQTSKLKTELKLWQQRKRQMLQLQLLSKKMAIVSTKMSPLSPLSR